MGGRNSVVNNDDGQPDQPLSDGEWSQWVDARRLRNWCAEDPLLDWLDAYPTVHGYRPDNEANGFNNLLSGMINNASGTTGRLRALDLGAGPELSPPLELGCPPFA